MARIAYIMDRPMKAIGLHGKAFIPFFGFGCNVPAIMSTRTLDSHGIGSYHNFKSLYILWRTSSRIYIVCKCSFLGIGICHNISIFDWNFNGSTHNKAIW